MLKLTGINTSQYFIANIFGDLTVISIMSAGIFALASLFNLSIVDHTMILIGNLVFFFEMISFCYLIVIVSRGSFYCTIVMTKVFFLCGFVMTYLLDNLGEDKIKDFKRKNLFYSCNPFIYFYWIMQSQMMLNKYRLSLYQV